MKRLVFKKWVELLMILIIANGIYLIGILEHNSLGLYIYGTLLVVVPSFLLVKYGRN